VPHSKTIDNRYTATMPVMVSSYPFVFRVAILAAIVVTAGCEREIPVSHDTASITYVDATDGPSGNTTLATGEILAAVTTAAVRNDNLWGMRSYGNAGTVFTSNDIGGSGSEDAPQLVTTIQGLAPDDRYEIFAYFWSDHHNWHLQASLAPFGDSDPDHRFSKDATESSVVAPPAVEANFDSPMLVTESNRTMYQARVGEATADSNGEVRIWIDDNPNASERERTWYDGVGYRLAGHRVWKGRTIAGLVILVTIILAAIWYLIFRLLRNRSTVQSPTAE
jgi:hypothetical protein